MLTDLRPADQPTAGAGFGTPAVRLPSLITERNGRADLARLRLHVVADDSDGSRWERSNGWPVV